MNDELPATAQAIFKAFDLGLYRLGDADAAKTEANIDLYLNGAEAQAEYYVVLAKFWTGQQRLSALRVYLKLPNTLPAYELYTEKELEKSVRIHLGGLCGAEF